jgi:hypothetical protein
MCLTGARAMPHPEPVMLLPATVALPTDLRDSRTPDSIYWLCSEPSKRMDLSLIEIPQRLLQRCNNSLNWTPIMAKPCGRWTNLQAN